MSRVEAGTVWQSNGVTLQTNPANIHRLKGAMCVLQASFWYPYLAMMPPLDVFLPHWSPKEAAALLGATTQEIHHSSLLYTGMLQ